MWTIFKVFIEFATILLLFYIFWFFGHKACGILAPRPGMEPAPPALEGEALTTGPPGKSLNCFKCYSDLAFHIRTCMYTVSLISCLGFLCLCSEQVCNFLFLYLSGLVSRLW